MIQSFIGAAAIITSGAIIGNRKARIYIDRQRQLTSLIYALHMLDTHISYAVDTMPKALNIVGKGISGQVGDVFVKYAKELEERSTGTMGDIWKDIKKSEVILSINVDDYGILDRLFSSLGHSGRDDHIRLIRIAQEQLRVNEAKARDEAEVYPKLFRYLGLFGAFIVVLVLL